MQNDESLDAESRQKELQKLEWRYYYRRIINSTYFMQLKSLILSRNYI